VKDDSRTIDFLTIFSTYFKEDGESTKA